MLSLPHARSTFYGTNSVHFKESLIWNNLPSLEYGMTGQMGTIGTVGTFFHTLLIGGLE